MKSSSTSYAFLSWCLSDTCTPLEVRSLGWEAAIRLAAEEEVLPAVGCRLREKGIVSELPPEIADFFDALHTLGLERNRRILSELQFVASLLNGVGIEPVVLKGGAYLLDGVFHDLSARYLEDIDMLVPPSELTTAVQVLKLHTYRELEQSRRRRSIHYPMLRRLNGPGVELHHAVAVGDSSAVLTAAEVLSQSTPIDFQGAQLRLPCPEHLITHHFLHCQVHNRGKNGYDNRIWPTLKALYDLYSLNRRYRSTADWRKAAARFERIGKSFAFKQHLSIASDVLAVEPRVPIDMKGLSQGRWYRTRMLRAHPWLRHADPVYHLLFTVVPWAYRRWPTRPFSTVPMPKLIHPAS